MPRKYIKTSPHWTKKPDAPVTPAIDKQASVPETEFKWDGDEPFSSRAACGGYSRTYKDGGTPSAIPMDAYSNIDSGLLPWEYNNGMVGISRPMILVQKAYANVAVVRNAIESAVEFSCSKIHVKCPNDTVKKYFETWLNRIMIDKFQAQWYRSFYREGQVFSYKFLGQIEKNQYINMKKEFGATSDRIPIRYIIMNPAQIYLANGIGYNNTNFNKILSTYEVQRLREPQTTEDKQVFDSLPPAIKQQIIDGNGYTSIFMPLDPARIQFAFYKKQDFEPFAVPMVWPVLNDIEYKLDLKKMDMSLARTMEHVILLVKNGMKNDEYNKAGMNPNTLNNLAHAFKNTALGRVLVADHTTSAEWLIPPIADLLGPTKYQQVESDIREGLQSIIMGDDKFANAQIKAKVFIERLKEGQGIFMGEFLVPEVNRICEQMGFRNIPTLEYEQIDLNDQTNAQRNYVRLAELGILTPAEVMQALKTGVMPEADSNLAAQTDYTKQREKGYWYPLVGGSADPNEEAAPGASGRPAATKAPQTTKKMTPMGTKGTAGDRFGAYKMAELMTKAEALKQRVALAVSRHYKITQFTPEQESVVLAMTRSIVVNEEVENWTEATAKIYILSPVDIEKESADEIRRIGMEYDVNDWTASVLLKAKV